MEVCRGEGGLARVDVIVPCYNYGRFLRQCVRSVLDQAGIVARVLIIDDASSDDTGEIAAALALEDPRVRVISHTANIGHIKTYNEGISLACADYILLLSADDYLMPGALFRATNLMDAHPEVGFTFGNVIELSDDGTRTPLNSVIKPVDDSEQRILGGRELIELTGTEGNQVVTCTAVVRAELQKQLGGYRQELPHAGDVEMWLRFAAHGSVGFIFELQGVYRRHGASMSAAYYLHEKGKNAYRTNGRLADLQQQKLAFDFFSEYCRDARPQVRDLCPRLYRNLSETIASHASAAFNDGEMDEFRKLSEFALAVCPEVENSREWLKLVCKRWMGRRIWRALRPAVSAMRAM